MTSGVYNSYNAQNHQQGFEYQAPQQPNPPDSLNGQTQSQRRSATTDCHQVSPSNLYFPSLDTAAVYPVLRIEALHGQQQQRFINPPQVQYDRRATTAASASGSNTMPTRSRHIAYSHPQLPCDDNSRTPQNTTLPSSYSIADNYTAAPTAQASAPPNIARPFDQPITTVDSIAVYNPWPEDQQQGNMLALKAVEAAHQREERWREQRSRKADEVERPRQAEEHNVRMQAQPTMQHVSPTSDGPPGEANIEAEIRTMMSKIRELSNKDSKLLARIWEEERRVKVPSSPSTQLNSAPRPATAQTGSSSAPVVANQGKKAVPKESPTVADFASSHGQTPVTIRGPIAKPQSRAVVTGTTRPTGNTIWPADRKAPLAAAAANYLNAKNPTSPITMGRILGMLEGNPSYVELCEYLEAESLELDRAAFAKSLLTAVLEIKSGSRSQSQAQNRSSGETAAPQISVPPVRHTLASPTIVTNGDGVDMQIDRARVRTAVTRIPWNEPSSLQVHNTGSVSRSPVPVMKVAPASLKSRPPAHKEEAARKRNFNNIIDLTTTDDEDEMELRHKKLKVGATPSAFSSAPAFGNAIQIDEDLSPATNVASTTRVPSKPPQLHVSSPSTPLPPNEQLTRQAVVKPLDKKMALRRNGYHIKTIARDVLLACGRHPTERQLNAHLDILKTSLAPSVSNDSDLSTLRWDLLDPGTPPKGFYRGDIQSVVEDADDEDDSEDEVGRCAPQSTTQVIAVGGAADARVQALTPTNNPKSLGRPPRRSCPDTSMSTSASPPKGPGAGVGYAAFRSVTAFDAEGKPLPKKKGRPVGWRKAIHGSAAAQQSLGTNKQTDPSPKPSQAEPSKHNQSQNIMTRKKEPATMQSRSPSARGKAVRYQTYDCKWQNCKAKLHNLATLKKHVHKRHRRETDDGNLECLWDGCGKDVTRVNPTTRMRMKIRSPFAFTEDSEWRNHLELRHFVPLSWELGDGPATGLSGKEQQCSDCNTRANIG